MAVGRGRIPGLTSAIDAEMQRASTSDGYDSGYGYSAERGELAREAAESMIEEERDPRLAGEVIDNADADAVLLQQILADRRGLRGVWNRFKNSRVTRGVVTCLKWGAALGGAAIVGGAIAGGGLALVAPGAMIAGAAEGGVIGAALGAITGKRAGKVQQENAATWMSDLKILRSTHAELERTGEGELMVALGIMRNAIMNRKVRGTDAARMEMVLKYRQIKNILGRRREEAQAEGLEGENLNPAMRAIDEALKESDDELKAISESAGEKYKEAYDTLIEDKNRIVRAFIRKNALKRGAFGAVFGALAPMVHAAFAGPDSAVSTVGQGTALGSESANAVAGGTNAAATGAHVAGESAAMAKMHALQGTDHIVQETATHATHMSDYAAGMHSDMMTFPPGTDMAIMDHLSRLENTLNTGAHGSFSGLHGGDLAGFDSLLHGGASNLHQISDFLWHHNIDSTFSINGQPFAEFLTTNQDTFLALPDVVQTFVLSHPSIAPDIFALAQHGTPAAASALLSKLSDAVAMATPFVVAAAPSAAVGVVAAGMTPPALGVKDKLYQEKNQNIGNVRKEANREVAEANTEIIGRRQEALRTRLIGARIQLDPTVTAAMFAAARTAGITAPRPDQLFDIANIDGDGNIVFVNRNTDWDRSVRAVRVNPYPSINLRQITNNDRTDLDPARATFIMSASEVDADRVMEAEDEVETATAEEVREGNLAQLRTILIGQNFILTEDFINDPSVPGTPADKAIWIANPRFRIQNIAAGLDGLINFAPRGTDTIPVIRMQDIVEALPSGNTYRLRFDRIQPVGTLPTIAPTAPGTSAAPTAPAAPTGPDQAALEAEFITDPGNNEQTGQIVTMGSRKLLRTSAVIPSLGSRDIPLDPSMTLPNDIDRLPNLTVRLGEVKVAGGRPIFNGEVFIRTSTAEYRIDQKFNAGVATGARATSDPKAGLLSLLETVAPSAAATAGAGGTSASMHLIFFPGFNPNYLQFHHTVAAVPGATPPTLEQFVFHEVDPVTGAAGGADVEVPRPLLEARPFFHLEQI